VPFHVLCGSSSSADKAVAKNTALAITKQPDYARFIIRKITMRMIAPAVAVMMDEINPLPMLIPSRPDSQPPKRRQSPPQYRLLNRTHHL
jgi:hypothetical protein